MSFSATLLDASGASQSDRDSAETAYKDAITNACPNVEILAKIYADDLAGTYAAADHFENCKSAWCELNQIGINAAKKKLGYWPGNGAHFEVVFP